jgi:hypothetical protein
MTKRFFTSLLDLIAWYIAAALTLILIPFLQVKWLEWRKHEHEELSKVACAAGDIEKEETLAGYMTRQEDGSFTWTWYP